MKYVVAVSGGVDSVVLLDMLVKQYFNELAVNESNLVVAHFDHGIRLESASDAQFVRELAAGYCLKYETKRVELGVNVSEERARQERYKFLRQCCKKHNAKLITAHHQDDLLETMAINLLRGTGWRGLVSLSSDTILRPLLNSTKVDLLKYAKRNNLSWREDSTNLDTKYLRNYVRINLMPRLLQAGAIDQFLVINQKTQSFKKEIATLSQKLICDYQTSTNAYELPRYLLIMLPYLVAQELIYEILTTLDSRWYPKQAQIKRVLWFSKTGLVGKQMMPYANCKVSARKSSILFEKQ